MNRKKAEKFILEQINNLAPGNENVEIYKKRFSEMSDKEFHLSMMNIKHERKFISFISPNFTKHPLTIERNLKIAKELGHDFFTQIWVGAKGPVPAYLTPNKYLVIDLPVRRMSQLLIKKIKVPENNRTVDQLTSQPTGASKGSRISKPELDVLASMGMDNAIVELYKYRGGDPKGLNALNGMISRYGKANIKTLANYASGVASTRTLKDFLTASHLSNTLT